MNAQKKRSPAAAKSPRPTKKSKPTSSKKPLTLAMKKKMRSARVSGVIITGASSGIGYAFAEYYTKLYAAGTNKVILVSRNAKRLSAAEKRLQALYPSAQLMSIPVDLSSPQGAAKVWAICQKKKIRVGTLINNAGFGQIGSFLEANEKEQRKMIGVNIYALVELSRLFLYEMRRVEDRGTLINVASTAALQGMPGFAFYAATKAFVLNFTEGLAEECRDMDVQVLVVCPGVTQTEFLNVALPEEKREQFLQKVKRLRPLQPKDVVETTMQALSADRRGMVIADRWFHRAILSCAKFLPRSLSSRLSALFFKGMY